MIILVTYDFRAPEPKRYADLYEVLGKLGTSRIHPLESVWMIATKRSANEIYNDLRPIFDENDRLLVAEFTQESQGWLAKSDWDWVYAHR